MKFSPFSPRCFCAAAGLSLANVATAQLNLTSLHSFAGGTDGQQPEAALVQASDGFLYGTTFMGGANNAGTIFKVKPDGSGNTPIYHFTNNPNNPFGLSDPSGLIQGQDGALYGTSGGGGNGYGSVFRLNTDGSGFTTLHSFMANDWGGYQPEATVVQAADGYLYGTTAAGGMGGGGTVFRVSTNGSGFLQLHAFGVPGDAQGPQAPLIQGADGALYGTSSAGGTSMSDGGSGYGTVFKINTDGSGETVLHSFLPTGGDGVRPRGALIQGSDGTLFGVTQEGGSQGFGTLFKLLPNGSGYAILHEFNPAVGGDGKYPWPGLVIGSDGALYGTTVFGGGNNSGVIFKIRPDGSGYTVLYAFGSRTGDGSNPGSPLIRANDGGLFGTAPFGGDMNAGILFRLAPAPAVLSSIKALPNGTMQVSLTGAPHFNYRMETSSDHMHWVTFTNVYNSTGVMQITDPEAARFPQRYYRAAWIP